MSRCGQGHETPQRMAQRAWLKCLVLAAPSRNLKKMYSEWPTLVNGCESKC